ncbi:MAG: hypothetical protein KJN64_03695 [Ignavibacteria bacterium]|nr:hypothetical protein [Ignavibacteria bacterium]MBT8380773.1 hypothetical protein [Ignavibacteria bacterium]MBT8390290.1 hypothetical protein [Ignavibacteria bacterium]NNJ53222.1 hypothetical protein [Ignavibacteriaceae bacterium]NNL22331.1 hypothetical protein [Ignavibacteriaceae bacterium]
MKKFSTKIFLVVLLLSLNISAQQYTKGSPEWLVDMFFNSSSFEEKINYYTGEMMNDLQQPTIGEELKESDAQILFYKILEKDNRQNFAVELEVNERVIDFYCYIIKENETWKIEAIRRFLLPRFIYSVYDSLSNLPSPSPPDQNLMKTLQLFTMNDAQLKNYLNSKDDEYSNIVWYFNRNENEEVDSRLSLLGCNAVYKDNRFPSCVFIQINTFKRMETGFFYANEKSVIPLMSPKEFIYIEKVLPGWYLYRIM